MSSLKKIYEQLDAQGTILRNLETGQQKHQVVLDKHDRKFDKIDERFERIDERFDKIDKRFERIDERFERIDERFERIERSQRDHLELTHRQGIFLEHLEHKIDTVFDAVIENQNIMKKFGWLEDRSENHEVRISALETYAKLSAQKDL